jgi:hypothetical protein
MYDFERKIEDYKRRYIYDRGERKYNRIIEKIKKSKTLASALEQSVNNNHALLAGDFGIISDSAMSFISGPSTAIMGSLIALEIWNERCNENFKFLDEFELVRVTNACLKRFG